jgi:hypothetical protein
MTSEQLQKAITARAQKEVDAAWYVFKAEMANALGKLQCGTNLDGDGQIACVTKAVRANAGYGSDTKLPAGLWRTREEAILKEILGTMDALQKTRAAIGYEPQEIEAAPANSSKEN